MSPETNTSYEAVYSISGKVNNGESNQSFEVPTTVKGCLYSAIIVVNMGITGPCIQQNVIAENTQPPPIILSSSNTIDTNGTNYLTKKLESDTTLGPYIKSPFSFEAYNGIIISDIEGGVAVVNERFISLNAAVYGSLTVLGVIAILLSALSVYVLPLFDINIARVLLPMSFGFIGMIGIDYLLRGKEHA